jgi:VWFA-related protein
MTPSAPFGREHERNSQAGADAHPSTPVVASAESAGRPITQPGESQDEAALAALGSSNSWEVLARNKEGYASTDALLALAATMGKLNARRSIVLFADHLAIPDAVLPHFNNVIATACRAEVSVYTVDVAGLRVHTTDAETGREVRAIGAAGLKTNDDGSSQSTLALMERNEDVLRKDPRTSLTLLANRTGGSFTGSTNDLARGLRRVVDDHRFYYVLGYTPKKPPGSGRWWNIQVKVDRRKTDLRHRQGYVDVGSEKR